MKTKTKTKPKTKTQTKCSKDKTYAIFLKSIWFKDINYEHQTRPDQTRPDQTRVKFALADLSRTYVFVKPLMKPFYLAEKIPTYRHLPTSKRLVNLHLIRVMRQHDSVLFGLKF